MYVLLNCSICVLSCRRLGISRFITLGTNHLLGVFLVRGVGLTDMGHRNLHMVLKKVQNGVFNFRKCTEREREARCEHLEPRDCNHGTVEFKHVAVARVWCA